MNVAQLGRIVGHYPSIDRSPFIAVGSQPRPGKDRLIGWETTFYPDKHMWTWVADQFDIVPRLGCKCCAATNIMLHIDMENVAPGRRDLIWAIAWRSMDDSGTMAVE